MTGLEENNKNVSKENNKSTKDDTFIKRLIIKKNSDNTQNDISDFLCSLILTVVLFMPFIVIRYGERYYVDGKKVVLYVAAIVIFILLMISNNIKITKETKAALVFLGTICVSAVFSSFSNVALWGSTEREEGCIMFFVYIILFIAASSFLTINKRTIIIVLSAGSLMSAYTVLQMFQIDPIQKMLYNKIVTPNTSIATIGNSNFVSTYLCMFLIIAVALYIYKKNVIYLGFSAILFVGFLAARTRGGWISFALICLIGFIFIIRSKDRLIRAGIIIVTFCILAFSLNVITDNKIFDRAKISNIFIKTEETSEKASQSSISQNDNSENASTNDNQSTSQDSSSSNDTSNSKDTSSSDESNIKLQGSASSRTNILKVTLKAFLDKPFLGEGPDTLGLRLQRDYINEYNNHAKTYNEGIDKAHNEYLEYATSCGIFTLISYLALAGMILYRLFKNRKDENNIILFLAVLMYLVQAFFNISVIMVAPLFWILLGFATQYSYLNQDNSVSK